MLISEIFHSVQGEGEHMGVPVVFVRTWGCHVKCDFCDTMESWKWRPESVKEMKPEVVVEEVKKFPKVEWVVVTGGEPLVQLGIPALVTKLHEEGYKVALETSGSNATIGDFDWITVSPKPPLQYQFNIDWERLKELKYVVTKDFDEAVITEDVREAFKGHIWLQPDGNNMEECMGRCMEIALKDSRLRCGVQLHKLYKVK